MLVNNKFPKTIKIFVGRETNNDSDDDDDDDDDEYDDDDDDIEVEVEVDDESKRIFFAGPDLVQQRFYKNKKKFKKLK